MILTTLAYIAAAAGTLGMEADGITTYQGVKKFGPSIEGDKSAFAQWLVHHPPTLLFVKSLAFAGIEAALIAVGPRTGGGGTFTALVAGIIGALMGFWDAKNNYEVNSHA